MRNKKLIKSTLILIFTILYNHILHFYLVSYFCSVWPSEKIKKFSEKSLKNSIISKDESFGYLPNSQNSEFNPENVENISNFLIISDPHLLGPNVGFLDKFWHEYHMKIAYKSIMFALKLKNSGNVENPKNQKNSNFETLILGDILDFGLFLKPGEEFNSAINNFNKIFPNVHALVGNHDVAFPKNTNIYRINRINNAFGRKSSSEIINLLNVNFVILNSIAFSDNHSKIADDANTRLNEISNVFYGNKRTIRETEKLTNGSLTFENDKNTKNDIIRPVAPILIQHFPLWREDDTVCSDIPRDSANVHDRYFKNSPAREAIPEKTSKNILNKIKPKIVISGHTHNWCLNKHNNKIFEISVSSFSWRNRNNPTFLLLSADQNYISWQKCYCPRMSSIILIYVFVVFVLIFINFEFYDLVRRRGKYKTN